MFVFGYNGRLVDIKDEIARANTFTDAEGILFGLLEVRDKIGHVPLVRARVNNLITQAQRRRRELGNACPYPR